MLLRKRPRPPMKRTASLKEIVFDVGGTAEAPQPEDPSHSPFHRNPFLEGFDQRQFLAAVSPRNNRRHSGDFLETAQILRACSLCNRRLAPGRDIYMYKGESAFCSKECREEQMKEDEGKERC